MAGAPCAQQLQAVPSTEHAGSVQKVRWFWASHVHGAAVCMHSNWIVTSRHGISHVHCTASGACMWHGMPLEPCPKQHLSWLASWLHAMCVTVHACETVPSHRPMSSHNQQLLPPHAASALCPHHTSHATHSTSLNTIFVRVRRCLCVCLQPHRGSGESMPSFDTMPMGGCLACYCLLLPGADASMRT